MKLERFKEKRKINKLTVIIFVLLLITGGYLLTKTFSKYIYETENIPFINGTVKMNNADIIFAFYKDGESIDEIPTKESGYILDIINSGCDNEASIEWDSERWTPTIVNLTKTKTKCNLYFGKKLADTILLADQTSVTNVEEAKQKIKEKGSPDFNTISETDDGLYMADDDLGESYYFRGNVTDNWVKFANFYWRIIRINGDGTVRMIYNGPTTSQDGETTQVTKMVFHDAKDNPKYVGYMWGDYNAETHTYANDNDSAIKNYLENEWFDGALGNYTDYLADEIFCNDRTIVSGNGANGSNNYGAYQRIRIDKLPVLTCANANDRFAKETKVGNIETNGKLNKLVGLVTSDEIAMSGQLYATENTNYYLCTKQFYWTMTPYSSVENVPLVFYNYNFCALGNNIDETMHIASDTGVRPVINIRSDLVFSKGNGTKDQPYTLYINSFE